MSLVDELQYMYVDYCTMVPYVTKQLKNNFTELGATASSSQRQVCFRDIKRNIC